MILFVVADACGIELVTLRVEDLGLTVSVLGATSSNLDASVVHALKLETVLLLVSVQHAALVSVMLLLAVRWRGCVQAC